MVFLFLFLSYVINGFKQKKNNFFKDFLLILPIILIAGLRYRVGGDTSKYMEWYAYMPTLDEIKFYEVIKFQPLWLIFNSSFKSLDLSYFHFQFFHAVILNLSFIWLLRKYNFNTSLGVLLYFVLIAGKFNFEILRESLAIVFFFHGYFHLNKKQNLLFIFFFLIAINFHISVLMAIPILILNKNKKLLIPLILACFIFSFLIETFLLNDFKNYVEYTPTVYGIIYNIIFSLFFVYFITRFVDKKRIILEINTVLYSLVFATVMSFKYFIFFRLYNYIDILIILLILKSYNKSLIINFSNKIFNMSFIIICIICVRIVPLFFNFQYDSEIPWIRQWHPYENIINGKENLEREKIFKKL